MLTFFLPQDNICFEDPTTGLYENGSGYFFKEIHTLCLIE